MKKRLVACGLLLFSIDVASQENEFLDYIVTQERDTIYGIIRTGFFKSYLEEINKNPQGEEDKFTRHPLKDILAYRYNDFVNTVEEQNEDGVYATPDDLRKPSTQNVKPDFAITTAGDTLYGEVSSPVLGKVQLVSGHKKIKIKFPEFVAYRQGNILYEYREKNHKVHWLDPKAAFMPVLFRKDEFTLYGWTGQNPAQKVYYLAIGPNLYFIDIDNVWKVVYELFDDHADLVRMLSDGIYDYDHLPLIVKYYATKTGS